MKPPDLSELQPNISALLILACLIPAATAARSVSVAVPLTLQQITTQMDQADQRRQDDLEGYSVTRRYVLHNSHMSSEASMLVRLAYSKAGGKTFQILEEHGVEGMSRRVFQHLLQAESESNQPDNRQRGRVNSRNYEFRELGTAVENGRNCYLLELRPKTKTKYLINGKAWVDAEDFGIVKLEGRPAASISFWVGKPQIEQTWEKVGDFWMAASNRSHAESRLLGITELVVENAGYKLSPATLAIGASRKLCTHRGTAAGATVN